VKLVIIDTETGGTDAEQHSLLEIAAIVWEDGLIGDPFRVDVIETPCVVTPEALAINKIDITQRPQALHPIAAKHAFDRWMQVHGYVGEAAIACGHNVDFDLRFLRRLYRIVAREERRFVHDWLFSHRTLDTMSLIRFDAMIDGREAIGLSSALDFYGIARDDRHTALGDVLATAQLLNALLAKHRERLTMTAAR
jgi:DNA polymerase III epsilon subunit-like protein